MTDRPPLTLADIIEHQRAKGLHTYGRPLSESGLPQSAVASHALEELVDLANYVEYVFGTDDPAVCWFLGNALRVVADRLLPLADHPKPLPPDVPTVEAVREFGEWWQLGHDVVRVEEGPRGLRFRFAGLHRAALVDLSDLRWLGRPPRWLGPVTLRAVRS